MFELQDEAPDSGLKLGERKVKQAESPIPASKPGEGESRKQNKLDAEVMVNQHLKLLALYRQELDRQESNRFEMASDEDFYDNIQWSAEDSQALKERGQMPLVYNVISSSVNWVLGTEKRGRTDFKILPRRKEDGKPAERKTSLLKYLSDVNRTPFHRSRAFEDAVKVGLGWIEDGVQDDDDGEPVYCRYESWRNMLWDSASTEMDLSDARYVFRTKWIDLDIATAMFPSRAAMINESAVEGDRLSVDGELGDEPMDSHEYENESYASSVAAGSYQRDRVRLIECWFRKPENVKRLRGGDFNGEVYEPDSPIHLEQLQQGRTTVVQKVMMRMHVAIMTTKGFCWYGVSPYRHNRYPFTPIWCYRRGRDGMPYGMIRGLKDIQSDINKRASKALHILSTNKTIMDEGAVPDLDEYLEEVSKPDAVIVKKAGKELVINAERELSAAHIELMSRSIAMIQQQSGVTDEAMGRTTNATSGVAIGRRQEQGAMATAKIFDNLRFACQLQGEIELALIEQYFSEKKAFRITNMRGTPEYITINDGLPENDIVHTKADFIISESDWRNSVRQAQVEELLALMMQLAPVAPQAVMVMLDLAVESMDLPSREEMVKRIRQITGMRDPDATELSPEEQQQEAEKQRQAKMQEAMFNAELAGKEADAAKKQADAQKAGVQAQELLAKMAGQNVQTQKAALEAALAAISVPQTVHVADGILHEAGYVGRTEGEANQAQDARTAAIEEQAALEEQMALEQQAAQQQGIQGQQQPAAQQPGLAG